MTGTDVVSLTCRLIGAASENPPGNEGRMVSELTAVAADLGLSATVEEALPGSRSNVLISPGPLRPGTPMMMILGHSDVVPAGPGWTTDPFVGQLIDGQIVGRGSCDMKGGLAAALCAMAELPGQPDGVDLLLAVTVDEEEGGRGAQQLVAAHPEWDVRVCVVAEPTGLQVVRASKGNSYHGIEVRGAAAHASSPDNGRSAITAAARIVLALADWHRELALAEDPLVGAATWNVGTIEGGTSTAMVPDTCRIAVDRRLTAGQTAAQVEEELTRRISEMRLDLDGIAVTVDTQMEMPGFVTAEDDPFVQQALRTATAVTGTAQPIVGWRAACDGGFVQRAHPGASIVILGPGDVTGQAHRPNESVPAEQVVQAAEVFSRLFAEIDLG